MAAAGQPKLYEIEERLAVLLGDGVAVWLDGAKEWRLGDVDFARKVYLEGLPLTDGAAKRQFPGADLDAIPLAELEAAAAKAAEGYTAADESELDKLEAQLGK